MPKTDRSQKKNMNMSLRNVELPTRVNEKGLKWLALEMKTRRSREMETEKGYSSF